MAVQLGVSQLISQFNLTQYSFRTNEAELVQPDTLSQASGGAQRPYVVNKSTPDQIVAGFRNNFIPYGTMTKRY